jgi:lipopolysaccharide transport system permease protein
VKNGEMPLPTYVIQRRSGLDSLHVAALWEYRELLYFLVWRDIKVRYKQTLLGAGWAIFQPLISMAVFTLVFGNLAKIPSDGLPYAVFVYTALLPWTYFSQALSRTANGLVSNAGLITKVYFPRLIIPLSDVTSPAVDFLCAFLVLLGLIAWYGIAPSWGVLALPLFFLLAVLTALAIGLWLGPLNARYRDVGVTIPFLTQFWMFASPVVYPISLIPESWRLVYSLNPMVGVIEGFRWGLLGKENPDFSLMLVSLVVVLLLLVGGVIFFKRMERTFADVI